MSLVPGLVASGLPPWRDPRKTLAAYIEVIGSILYAPRSGAALLIAEDGHRTPLGFTLLVAATDCYTHERHGHVAQIVVVDPQDMVVGPTLIAAAEDWARSRGYRLLTMSEFWANHPARALCQQLGFVEEIVKYRKNVR
jgi:GNAT superfamily N-acetyltransferase